MNLPIVSYLAQLHKGWIGGEPMLEGGGEPKLCGLWAWQGFVTTVFDGQPLGRDLHGLGELPPYHLTKN